VAAQKFQMAYRLMFDCEQLQTPLLDAQMALSKLRLCDLFWVAWTEFGGVGEGRRVSVIPSHPGLDPADLRRDRVEKMRKKITI
jgi:hypothetical protein